MLTRNGGGCAAAFTCWCRPPRPTRSPSALPTRPADSRPGWWRSTAAGRTATATSSAGLEGRPLRLPHPLLGHRHGRLVAADLWRRGPRLLAAGARRAGRGTRRRGGLSGGDHPPHPGVDARARRPAPLDRSSIARALRRLRGAGAAGRRPAASWQSSDPGDRRADRGHASASREPAAARGLRPAYPRRRSADPRRRLSAAAVYAELAAIGPELVGVHGNVDDAALRALARAHRGRARRRAYRAVHDAWRAAASAPAARIRDADAVVFGHSHMPPTSATAAFRSSTWQPDRAPRAYPPDGPRVERGRVSLARAAGVAGGRGRLPPSGRRGAEPGGCQVGEQACHWRFSCPRRLKRQFAQPGGAAWLGSMPAYPCMTIDRSSPARRPPRSRNALGAPCVIAAPRGGVGGGMAKERLKSPRARLFVALDLPDGCATGSRTASGARSRTWRCGRCGRRRCT